MEIDVLIDTSLLIAEIRRTAGDSQLTKAIEAYGFRNPAVSVVTKFEYELGELRAGRKGKFEFRFPNYLVIESDASIWQRAPHVQYFSIEANAKMELADLLIATTAIARKVPLLTLNLAHFAHLQTSLYRLRLPKIP